MVVEKGHGHLDVHLLLHGLYHQHQSSLSLLALAHLFSSLLVLLLLDLAAGYDQRPRLLNVLVVLLHCNPLLLRGRSSKVSDVQSGVRLSGDTM